MTAEELEQFLKQQASMSARIAKKANRAKEIAVAYSAHGGSRSATFADRVIQSLTRPGVAPGRRPKSATGGETFHFRMSDVTRSSEFSRRQAGQKQGAGAAHEAYIEREGAAEKLGEEVARAKSEMLDNTWTALGGQAYIERPGAAEPIDTYRLASFGNIAATFEERVAFWEAMEAAASEPKSNGIITQRGDDPAFWAKVDADPEAPAVLKNAPPFIPLPAADPNSPDNEPKKIPPPRLGHPASIAVLDYYRRHRSPPRPVRKGARPEAAVDFDPGRGGRIQTRLIVELPHELSAEQRLKLAQDFCHKEFVAGRENALPHWCVIHAPDHHNDPRNVHMHIAFAERPAKRMLHPQTGQECWNFEIQIKVRDANKHARVSRPFEQLTDRSIHSIGWIKAARRNFSELANNALVAAGKEKIYDPRTYEAMGIKEEARKRINGKDYLAEKQGFSTPAGDDVIKAQWIREEERLGRRFTGFGAPAKTIAAFDAEIKRWRGSPNSVSAHLMVHRHEYMVSASFIKVMRAERAANAFVLAKIQSKILPPLQRRDEEAQEATDFLNMFKRDIVFDHDDRIYRNNTVIERTLTALKRAQKADPKSTTDTAFLTGRPPLEIAMPEVLVLGSARGLDLEALQAPYFRALIEDHTEKRALREAVVEQLLARTGEIIYSNDPIKQAAWEKARSPKDPRPQKPTQADDLIKTTSEEIAKETATVLAEHRAAISNPSASNARSPLDAMPTQPVPVSLQPNLDIPIAPDDAYATSLRQLSENLNAKMPKEVQAAREELPADKRKYGDEFAIAFMSETGEPIQRRIYSPSRIRTADEHAAAVAAAIARRRAARVAENDAEMSALKVTRSDELRMRRDARSTDPKTTAPTPPDPTPPGGDKPAMRTATSAAAPPRDPEGPPRGPDRTSVPTGDVQKRTDAPRPHVPGTSQRLADERRPIETAKGQTTQIPKTSKSEAATRTPESDRAGSSTCAPSLTPAPALTPILTPAPRPMTPAQPLKTETVNRVPPATKTESPDLTAGRNHKTAPKSPQGTTPSKKGQSPSRGISPEEFRKRALLAARNRGRER